MSYCAPYRARIPLRAKVGTGIQRSPQNGPDMRGGRVGRLLSGGTSEPASKEKEEEESRNSFLLVMSRGISEALEMEGSR